MEQGTTNPAEGVQAAAVGVFVGSFVHSLDPKKRLTIPATWREQAGVPPSLYVLPAVHDPCLIVLPVRVMAERIARLRAHSISDPRARQFARVLGSRSDLVPWDVQGRIRIKDELLAHAGLTDQVVLSGSFDVFELWNPERWKATGSMDPDRLADAAQYVGF